MADGGGEALLFEVFSFAKQKINDATTLFSSLPVYSSESSNVCPALSVLSPLLFLFYQQSQTHLLIFSISGCSSDAFSKLSALSSVYLSCVLASFKAESSSAMITETFLTQFWQKTNKKTVPVSLQLIRQKWQQQSHSMLKKMQEMKM